MNRRALLGALAAAGAAGVSGCAGLSHPLPPLQGVVRRQSVVASGGGSARRLLDLSADGFRVAEGAFGGSLPRPDERANLTVSDSAPALDAAFGSVEYRIAVRPLDPSGPLVPASGAASESGAAAASGTAGGDVRRYAVNPATFGKLLVGDRIEFAVDPTAERRVSGLSTVVREGTVRAKRRDDDGARRVVCAHEDVGRRRYAVGPDPFDGLSIGERHRFRVGKSYGRVQRLLSVVDPAALPAYGRVR